MASKIPSDAVLKKAWMAGEDVYSKRHHDELRPTSRPNWKYLRRDERDEIMEQARAIARVILEAQGKGKKGKVRG